MSNIGIAPYDPTTLVGKVRAVTGDVNYARANPNQAGFGDYEMFSDADIEAFLITAEDNVLRSAGFGFMALAGRASLESKTIKDYDLSIDLKSLADSLRKQANEFFNQADNADARLGNLDVFELTRTGRDYTWPELAERENWWWEY
jgi:hypothetical protein